MKIGFFTACMPERGLEDIASWASANGYEALELASWPHLGDRPFTASHVRADAFDQAEAERVLGALAEHGLTLSALAYYDNNLAADASEREANHAHLRACIDAAARARRVSRSGRSSAATPDVASPRTCVRPSASSRRSWTTPASAACD